MTQRAKSLDLFYGMALMGSVSDTSPLAFEYSQSWLDNDEAFPLSVIPLQPGKITSPHVQAFFENLLPEGDLRIYLSTQRKASTLFSLLLEVAGDTAGAFVMLPQGQTPQTAQYEPTTWASIAHAVQTLSAAAIQATARSLAAKIPNAIDKAASEVAPFLTRSGQSFAEKLVMEVKSATRRTTARIAE